MHRYDTSKLSAAPENDIELVSNYFNDKCNCYSYAVQDYLAGHLSNQNDDDFSYLPRPGQSRGKTYLDLMGTNMEGMRRAVHEDGINFAGMTYPKTIPEGHYVICCFLEPTEYHFIRQNKDGSWTSKNGRGLPTNCDSRGEPITNPENFYHGDKNYTFAGYFFVPQGGVRVGVRAYEANRLKELEKHSKTPKEQQEKEVLKKTSDFSDYADTVVQKIKSISGKKGMNTFLEIASVWEDYLSKFSKLSLWCKAQGYIRKEALKKVYTRPKNAKKKQTPDR